jgi:S1-C subfamily serine protease
VRRLLAAGAALALTACATAPPVTERTDVLRRVLPSTVQLRSEREGGGRRAGSGVVIAADAAGRRAWILTTRHFLEPATTQQVFLTTPGGSGRLPAEVTAVSREVDLAVVEVRGVRMAPVRLKDEAALGDEVWVVAFPWGRRLTVVSGIVSQIDSQDVEAAVVGPPRLVDASVSYGASGGGVFDVTAGALIGIVESYRTARVTLERTPERAIDIPVPGETTVVSTTAIRKFLAEAGLADRLR